MTATRTVCALLLTSCGLLGCQGAGPTTPAAPGPLTQADLTAIPLSFGEGEHIAGLFQVDLDLAAGTGEVRPIASSRQALSDQATTYDVDISLFSKPGTLKVTGVTQIDSDTVEVAFTHAHPFPAPDWNQPATYLNRADLSYTGRLLILADVRPEEVAVQTFFGDTVANTTVVEGADGYTKVGDLLAESGFLANCFPYVLLADEDENNRIGVNNYNLPRGNYNTQLGGWQENNIGPDRIGWTGFDFIHAGQTIQNTVRFNEDAWNGGQPSFSAALLVKYTDPKGIPGKAIRLPPHDFNIFDFCYRVPHGCIDVSKITAPSTVQVGGSQSAKVTVDMLVRDWDAKAVESPEPDLSQAIGLMWIPEGHGGKPTNKVGQPYAGNGLWVLGPPSNESTGGTGEPHFEFLYRVTIENTAGWNDGITRPAFFRFTDPSFDKTTGPNRFGLDPVTLAPDAARALQPVTYQAINVVYGTPQPQPPADLTQLQLANTVDYAPGVAVTDYTDGTTTQIGGAYVNQAGALTFFHAAKAERANPGDYVQSVVDATPGDLGRLWMVATSSRLFIAAADHTSSAIVVWGSSDTSPTGPADWTRLDARAGGWATDEVAGLIARGNLLTLLVRYRGTQELLNASGNWPNWTWEPTLLDLEHLPNNDHVTPANYALTDSGVDATYLMPAMNGFTVPMAMFAHSTSLAPASPSDWDYGMLPWGAPNTQPIAHPLGTYGSVTLVQYPQNRNGAILQAKVASPDYTDFYPLYQPTREITSQSVAQQTTPSRVLLALDNEGTDGLHVRQNLTVGQARLGLLGNQSGLQEMRLAILGEDYVTAWITTDANLMLATNPD